MNKEWKHGCASIVNKTNLKASSTVCIGAKSVSALINGNTFGKDEQTTQESGKLTTPICENIIASIAKTERIRKMSSQVIMGIIVAGCVLACIVFVLSGGLNDK